MQVTMTNSATEPDLDYGYCVLRKAGDGLKKRQVVYYDDDEGKRAIVYPGQFLDGYRLVPLSSLRKASPREVADHVMSGRSLWPSSRLRIVRDVIELEAGEDEPEGITGDIAKDVRHALEVVEQLKGQKRRQALVKLAMLAMVWIDLVETELGQTPEDAETQQKARRNLGLIPGGSTRKVGMQ